MSKSYRLLKLALEILHATDNTIVEILDLSRLASEYKRESSPCKACISTRCALPLTMLCYPNHSLYRPRTR